MCGITGALALTHKAVNTTYVKPMTDILAHRGPDDAGYLFFHIGCRHERNVAFELHLTYDKFNHISELLPSIESREGHPAAVSRFLGISRVGVTKALERRLQSGRQGFPNE